MSDEQKVQAKPLENQPVLLAKLDSLARCLSRIESKKPFDETRLQRDLDLQDILSIHLERAVQQCVDIAAMIVSDLALQAPGTMAESFDLLCLAGWIDPPLADAMKKAVGFRNIAVHEYEKMSWPIVISICYKNIDDFRAFARAVESRLPATSVLHS